MPTAAHLPMDHMVILLSNLEQDLPFYEALLPLLGFARARDHVFANPDGVYLDFRQAREPEHGYHRYAPGLNHLGFSAPDRAGIERIAAAMAEAGFEVPAIQEFPDGSAIFFKDANGMRIEVGSYHETALP